MSPPGAPSTALVITASVTAALVTAALGEVLRRLSAPQPRAQPTTEELVALVLAVQAKADRAAQPADRAAQPSEKAPELGGSGDLQDTGSRESSPRVVRGSLQGTQQRSASVSLEHANAGSVRSSSRGLQRSSSAGSRMEMQEIDPVVTKHTEDAVLRQMNLHLMGRGHVHVAC